MKKHTFALDEKSSISLCSMLERASKTMRPLFSAHSAGYIGDGSTPVVAKALVSVNLYSANNQEVENATASLDPEEDIEHFGDGYYSGRFKVATLQSLTQFPSIEKIQTKKDNSLHLDSARQDIGLVLPSQPRAITETGSGVLIGIVDSGFDLSHPMFWDTAGNLRVEALMDQTDSNREFDNAALLTGWAAGGNKPGDDLNGHGTHVATIAGGSQFKGLEGVAPNSRFLLVKTDFKNTDKAVSWIYKKAATVPCVINLSLGNHFGPHDGTTLSERLYDTLVGSGKILVVSAGNEREDQIHIGTRFIPHQTETVAFDFIPSSKPFVAVTFWYDASDDIEVEIITPSGQTLPSPTLGNTGDSYTSSRFEVETSRRFYTSTTIQGQIEISFIPNKFRELDLRNWRFRIRCKKATIGRFDLWFHNNGFAVFRPHQILEQNRTISQPATAQSAIAVASHVTKNIWDSDDGKQEDISAVIGRSSSFSSLGPTRDGRWKPEISAPGQYIIAGLAARSNLTTITERANTSEKLLAIEGTSMAAPIVTGAIACLLQKKSNLTPDQIRNLLISSVRRDAHTGPANWTPAYGHGKLNLPAAITAI